MARGALGETKARPRQSKNTGPRIGRHRDLLDNPKVRSWWEARALRSQLSADQYLRQLGSLLEHLDLTPEKIVTLAERDPTRLRDLLTRDAAGMKKKGRLDSYISKFPEGLKSYLRFHQVKFDGYPSLSPIRGASLENERVPTPEELVRLLDRLSLRGRTAALLMAHAGLRPGVLGSYQAEAGLTLADLPELKLGKELAFAEVPFVVRVPAGLSKTRKAYTTFGSSPLASTLLAYLSERREGGEKLSLSSPVVAVLPTRGFAARRRKDARFDRGFLTTTGVAKELHSALVSTAPEGVRFRVYSLRAYCSTRLLMAEGAGRITRDLREEMLGHESVAARYNLGKTWGPELLAEARASFKRAEPWLMPSTGATEETAGVVREILVRLGVPEEKLKGVDLTGKSALELISLAKELKGTSSAALAPIRAVVPERASQKVVARDSVPDFIESGYQWVADLDAARVILRAPQSGPGAVAPTI